MTPKLHLATPLLYALLTVVAVITLIPFVWVMFGAFKSQAEITALQNKTKSAGIISVVLLVFAAAGMAVARYL